MKSTMSDLSLYIEGPLLKFKYSYNTPEITQLHSHYNYEIYYFHRGQGHYVIGDRIHKLSPGDLFIMNGRTLHCAKIDPDTEYVRTTLHFDPASLQGLIDEKSALNIFEPFEQFGNYRIGFRGEDKLELESMLKRIHHLKSTDGLTEHHRFRLAIIDWLIYIYYHCKVPLQATDEIFSKKEYIAQQIISYLDKNYYEEITLDLIENKLYNSKFYLSKVFKEVTGITIFEYLNQRRIQQAKNLFLLRKELTVTDVCFEVGFKQLSHFSKLFKKMMGISPKRFSQNQIKKDNRKKYNMNIGTES